MAASDIEQQLQWLASYAQVSRVSKQQVKEAIVAYAYLASVVQAHGASNADLQSQAVAQQNLEFILTQPVQALQDAANSAQTYSDEMGDLTKALDLQNFEKAYLKATSAALISPSRF